MTRLVARSMKPVFPVSNMARCPDWKRDGEVTSFRHPTPFSSGKARPEPPATAPQPAAAATFPDISVRQAAPVAVPLVPATPAATAAITLGATAMLLNHRPMLAAVGLLLLGA